MSYRGGGEWLSLSVLGRAEFLPRLVSRWFRVRGRRLLSRGLGEIAPRIEKGVVRRLEVTMHVASVACDVLVLLDPRNNAREV